MGVACSLACVNCKGNVENMWHIFLGCQHAILSWSETGLWSIIEPIMVASKSFLDFVFGLLDKLEGEKMSICVMIMWSIWKGRNIML